MRLLIEILALVCAISMINAAPADEVDCGKLEEVFDEQGLYSGISFANRNDRQTENPGEELARKCPTLNDSMKILKTYNLRCNTGLTQQAFSSTFKTRQIFIDNFCNNLNGDHVKQAVENFKCLQKNLTPQLIAQEKRANLIAQVMGEMQYKDDKEKVTRMCCMLEQQKQEVADIIKSKCEKAIPLMKEFVDSYLAETIGLVCPDLKQLIKSNDCNKFDPVPIEGVNSKYRFFLAPMIKILRGLEH